MTLDLDDAVRSAVRDIVAAAPPIDGATLTVRRGEPARTRRPHIALAAGIVAVCATGALIVGRHHNASPELRPIDQPPASDKATTDSTSQVPTIGAPVMATSTSMPIDPTSPVAVTGQHIGDVIDDTTPSWMPPDGEVDPTKLPAWAGVGIDGRVVGYLKPVDVYLGEGDLVIYGEDGEPIGSFIDGKPVVTTTTNPLTDLELDPGSDPGDLVQRFTATLGQFGQLWVYDSASTGEVYLLRQSDAGTSFGSFDRQTYEDGQGWSFEGQPGADLLIGLAPPSLPVTVTFGDTTISSDANGLWFTEAPHDLTSFTLTTPQGSTTVHLAPSGTSPQTTLAAAAP